MITYALKRAFVLLLIFTMLAAGVGFIKPNSAQAITFSSQTDTSLPIFSRLRPALGASSETWSQSRLARLTPTREAKLSPKIELSVDTGDNSSATDGSGEGQDNPQTKPADDEPHTADQTNNDQPQPAPSNQEASNNSSFFLTLNFDDGFKNAYQNATPVLQAAGLDATFYIVSGFMGQTGYINEDEVLNLSAQGHEIGAHTRSHAHLTQLSEEEMRSEVEGSKQDLEKLGLSINAFAYPYGEYDEEVKQAVIDSGFSSARTAQGGLNSSASDPHLLKVQTLTSNTSLEEVKQWIQQAQDTNQWLVLVFHNIDGKDTYSVTSGFFEDFIDYVSDQNFPVLTMSEGAEKLGL